MPSAESFTLTMDSSELLEDIERIYRGELTFPTVSAVRVIEMNLNIPIYLEENEHPRQR
jgi:hypothetical protein